MRNILPMISTSVRAGHNPGDTFIGIGGQYIIEQTFGNINWHIINKFGGGTAWKAYEDLIEEAGLVFYGGMPQYNCYSDWCFWYDDEMWDLINEKKLKVFSLAGGAGFPDPDMTPKQFTDRCIQDNKTVEILNKRKENSILTTVRDEHAHALLNAVEIENYLMPCTALFSTRQVNIKQNENRDLVVLVPPSWKSIPSKYFVLGDDMEEKTREKWLDIYKTLVKKYKNVLIVCHFYNEYISLKDHISPENLFFTSDFLSLINIYQKAHTVVSARLHASIPAYGIPGTKSVAIAIDTRGYACEQLKNIKVINYNDIDPDNIISTIEQSVPSTKEEIDNILENYKQLLLSNNDLCNLLK